MPTIFLDKDGVINFDKDNGKYQNIQKILRGTHEAIKKINKNNYLAVLITNQPSIAKGFITEEKLVKDLNFLNYVLSTKGAFYDKYYYCPHYPISGFKNELKKYKKICKCRKPKNGMLLKAIKDLNVDVSKSYFIGDRISDKIAARKTKLKFIHISPNGKKNKNFKFRNLKRVTDYLFN